MGFHIAYAYRNKLINEQEFALFHDAHKSIDTELTGTTEDLTKTGKQMTDARLSFVCAGRYLWTCWADAAYKVAVMGISYGHIKR